MAALGHRVLHLSTPVTPAHLARMSRLDCQGRFANWRRGGVLHDHGLVDYVPLSLFPWPLAGRMVRARRNPFLLTMPSLRQVMSRFRFPKVDVLLIDEPRFAGLERLLKPKLLVYRATDLYGEMKNDRAMEAAERAVIDRADALVGTSEPVLAKLREHAPDKPSLLLENGVEHEHFSLPAEPPPEYADIPAPRLVYAGALDERFDFEAIALLAQRLPNAQIVLIGPGGAGSSRIASARANIHALGAKPYATLPAYLQGADIGLLPLSDHPANAGRSPMKLYEYAAAGLPVAARHTPELMRRGEASVHLYQTGDELVALVQQLLSTPPNRSEIQASAQAHAWASKAEELLAFLGSPALSAQRGAGVPPDA